MWRWFKITCWIGAVFLLGWIIFGRLPPQHSPLAPLSLSDPIGLATSYKLATFQTRPQVCFEFLDASRIKYTPLEDGSDDEPCGFRNSLRLDQSALPYNVNLDMTCPLTAALAVWERQSLVIQAAKEFEAPPRQVLSYGSFSCRRLYGRSTGDYSEHATGNAIDIRGVILADGTKITVLDHWGKKTPEGRLLKNIRDDACDLFGTVLGPEYNDAHADHFHFDMSQTGICR